MMVDADWGWPIDGDSYEGITTNNDEEHTNYIGSMGVHPAIPSFGQVISREDTNFGGTPFGELLKLPEYN